MKSTEIECFKKKYALFPYGASVNEIEASSKDKYLYKLKERGSCEFAIEPLSGAPISSEAAALVALRYAAVCGYPITEFEVWINDSLIRLAVISKNATKIAAELPPSGRFCKERIALSGGDELFVFSDKRAVCHCRDLSSFDTAEHSCRIRDSLGVSVSVFFSMTGDGEFDVKTSIEAGREDISDSRAIALAHSAIQSISHKSLCKISFMGEACEIAQRGCAPTLIFSPKIIA